MNENLGIDSTSVSKRSATSMSSMASEKKCIGECDNNKIDEENMLLQRLEETSKGKIKGSLLANYLKSAQRPILLAFLLSSFFLTQILASGADMFVPYWLVSLIFEIQ